MAALIDDDDQQQQANNSANKKLDAFEKYIKNLEQSGTYADNGCLVAFARLYNVDINIHQLNMPIWTIHGNNKNQQVRQLHLSYHNGEHYSSIRPLGDRSNQPTNFNTQNDNYSKGSTKTNESQSKKSSKKSKETSSNATKNAASYEVADYKVTDNDYVNFENQNSYDYNVKVEQIIEITKCLDVSLIKEKLSENGNDLDLTINSLMSQMNLINNNNYNNNGDYCTNGNENYDADDDDADVVSKSSNGNVKSGKEKKQEKKQRQEERQRIKILEQREKEAHNRAKDVKNAKVVEQNELVSMHQQQQQQQVDNPQIVDLSGIQTKAI